MTKPGSRLTSVRRQTDLITLPRISISDYARRLNKLELTQLQLSDMTGISRLRIRKLMDGDPSSADKEGNMFGYLVLLLLLLESGLLQTDVEETDGKADYSAQKLIRDLKELHQNKIAKAA